MIQISSMMIIAFLLFLPVYRKMLSACKKTNHDYKDFLIVFVNSYIMTFSMGFVLQEIMKITRWDFGSKLYNDLFEAKVMIVLIFPFVLVSNLRLIYFCSQEYALLLFLSLSTFLMMATSAFIKG